MVVNWDLYSFVVRGKHRLPLLRRLIEGPCQPVELAGILEGVRDSARMSVVSHALKNLVGKCLNEELTPDLTKGRIYGITELGRQILETVGK
ncbi:MAG: hypothetical protein ACTSU5_17935 [Promethearchaeota archaeon]